MTNVTGLFVVTRRMNFPTTGSLFASLIISVGRSNSGGNVAALTQSFDSFELRAGIDKELKAG